MIASTLNTKAFGRVAVVHGGISSERQVSLQSGQAVFLALQSKGIDAHGFDPKHDSIANLVHFDRVFNILHGSFGEDGCLQGALDLLNIPYTGSGVLASALAMDKLRCRQVWQASNLPNVPYVVLHDDSDFEQIEQDLGLPLFVKPAAEGSSVGVMMIENKGQLRQAYPKLKQYHGAILAEQALMGGEYACSIITDGDDIKALPIVQIIPKGKFYDYEAKYVRDDTTYQCPASLSDADTKAMQDLAKKAFLAIGCRHWARVDFLKSATGQIYLLELNTQPGMTGHSLVPMAAAAAGLDFEALCVHILAQTL